MLHPFPTNHPGGTNSVANYFNNDYATKGSPTFVNTEIYLTDVGAYTTPTSPYGTFDQGGNVWEWNETMIISSFRGLRGGGWGGISHFSFNLAASRRSGGYPSDGFNAVGFRVASIP